MKENLPGCIKHLGRKLTVVAAAAAATVAVAAAAVNIEDI